MNTVGPWCIYEGDSVYKPVGSEVISDNGIETELEANGNVLGHFGPNYDLRVETSYISGTTLRVKVRTLRICGLKQR